MSVTIMTETTAFNPNWASAPGDTVADIIEERGWSQTELAERLGFTKKHVSKLVNGEVGISADAAEKLARVLGSTTGFWMVREAQYRAALQRIAAEESLEEQAEWLKELPVAFMRKKGWIPDLKKKADKVAACLGFFGVASVEAWRTQYEEPVAAFRKSTKAQTEVGAVAAWMRRAERLAEARRCAPFDKDAFQKALQSFRAMTGDQDANSFAQQLGRRCAEVGVAVVFVPRPPKCPVSGVTKWISPDRALIVLSLRHKSNDHLWFTFFHEAGHILLHGKRLVFVEVDGKSTDEEKEADRFARNILIPPKYESDLRTLGPRVSAEKVRAFARRVGIAPGIVVGRLQREGLLPFSHLNGLKVRYTWEKD